MIIELAELSIIANVPSLCSWCGLGMRVACVLRDRGTIYRLCAES